VNVELQLLANISEIIGTLLVISGVFFGLVEIRHYRQPGLTLSGCAKNSAGPKRRNTHE